MVCITDESGSDTDIGSTSTCSSTSDLVSDFHPCEGVEISNDSQEQKGPDEVDNTFHLNQELVLVEENEMSHTDVS